MHNAFTHHINFFAVKVRSLFLNPWWCNGSLDECLRPWNAFFLSCTWSICRYRKCTSMKECKKVFKMYLSVDLVWTWTSISCSVNAACRSGLPVAWSRFRADLTSSVFTTLRPTAVNELYTLYQNEHHFQNQKNSFQINLDTNPSLVSYYFVLNQETYYSNLLLMPLKLMNILFFCYRWVPKGFHYKFS